MSTQPLTADQRRRIMDAITASQTPDDKDPQVVVDETYEGDWDTYLRVMAGWHGVAL